MYQPPAAHAGVVSVLMAVLLGQLLVSPCVQADEVDNYILAEIKAREIPGWR